ncbi:MAG TPA: YafY family protein [Dinghuibacter sp.]|uniref:helix-turn-helix transcriptional regulator n=1 Tax=Dinghuibacter sp. TaxID=2024697 RepID=UPI002CD2C824|nr:YafY family protein [Dinghuibacter sp.]HTJ11213.1 YafY family protein [Dinghuibacter sp.]
MNRIDRLHAILVHLQSKRRVTGQEIADRFGISLRSVYRDVKALEESGVPVIGEAGIGYSIMEGYRLPPVMFTQEEAAALLMGVKLTERFTDELTRKQIENALFKIKSVLRAPDREHIEQLSDNVVVTASRLPQDEGFNKYLSDLQKAIVAGRVVHLSYHTPYREHEQDTYRDVEPFGLCYYGQAWHCFAWCRMRKDYRDFKLTRIRDLRLSEDTFYRDQHPSLQEYLGRMVRSNNEVQEVNVLFDKSVVRHLGEQKYYYGFVRQEFTGDMVRMTFLTGHPEYMAHWLFSFADLVEVETPDSMKQLILKLFNRLKKKLSTAATS